MFPGALVEAYVRQRFVGFFNGQSSAIRARESRFAAYYRCNRHLSFKAQDLPNRSTDSKFFICFRGPWSRPTSGRDLSGFSTANLPQSVHERVVLQLITAVTVIYHSKPRICQTARQILSFSYVSGGPGRGLRLAEICPVFQRPIFRNPCTRESFCSLSPL